MASPRLDQLAEKYWDGTATEAEEQELRMAVQAGVSSPALAELADYLHFLEVERTDKQLDESFDQVLMAKIAEKPARRLSVAWYGRIAAGLALLMAVGWGIQEFSPLTPQASDEFADTYEDPAIAYQEVRKALMMVSSTMNDGLEPTMMLGEFHKAQEELIKQPIEN